MNSPVVQVVPLGWEQQQVLEQPLGRESQPLLRVLAVFHRAQLHLVAQCDHPVGNFLRWGMPLQMSPVRLS